MQQIRVQDLIEKVQKEFPEVDKKAVLDTVYIGLKNMCQLLRKSQDVFIDNSKGKTPYIFRCFRYRYLDYHNRRVKRIQRLRDAKNK